MNETSLSTTLDENQRAGIDYNAIPALLMDTVIKPGDANYPRVKSTFFRDGAPSVVFQLRNMQQVVEALAFARLYPHLPFSIRSGGHGVRGRSTNYGGIVIDLSRMNKIEILDEATRRVRIEPGARWKEVASALAPCGWALTSGDDGNVGVGGLATSGGIGLLARAYGLTIDHLRAVEMVLADGSIVRASEQENPIFSGLCEAPEPTSASSLRLSSRQSRSGMLAGHSCSSMPVTSQASCKNGERSSRTRRVI